MKKKNTIPVQTFKLLKYCKRISLFVVLTSLFLVQSVHAQQQRFPRPEFESGYVQPATETPAPRMQWMEYLDVAVLIIFLVLATWLVIKKRSRSGILWTGIAAVAYFGFFRNGCICPIGAIQNVTLSFFDPVYAVSLVVLLFFILPLIVTLFYGRTFCGGVCPLGALQDLVIVKPLSLPKWLNKTLGLIPYVFLSLAVLFAATGADFIICRYDPFIGIFRMDGKMMMITMGAGFLMLGMFIGRPYCRFLCPYGVLLSWASRFSSRHVTISPSKCISCKLCVKGCPFDAIDYPVNEKEIVKSGIGTGRFLLFAALIPLWIAIGVYAGAKSHLFLSKAHKDVYLAELMISNPEVKNDPDNLDVQTFLQSGNTMDMLVSEAEIIRKKFYTGSMIMGGFLGLVIGMTLLNTVVFRRRQDYVPHKGNCFSCGRCIDYCPVSS